MKNRKGGKHINLQESNPEDRIVNFINEKELGVLAIKLLEIRDSLSESFQKMDVCIGKLPSFYKGKPCDEIMDKYDSIKQNFPIIKQNIKNYSDDLLALIQKMKENDQFAATLFEGLTNDIAKQTQNIK